MSNNQSNAPRYYYGEFQRSLLITSAAMMIVFASFVAGSTFYTYPTVLGSVAAIGIFSAVLAVAISLVRTANETI